MQPVQVALSTVEATSKDLISHAVHLEPQAKQMSAMATNNKWFYSLSHSPLLLSAMSVVPSQTPLEPADTQEPSKKYVPDLHEAQSFDVPPVQVSHALSHTLQLPLSLKLPFGHVAPLESVCDGAVHFVLSAESCVKPSLHDRQAPVSSAHFSQPAKQTLHSPVVERK